MHYQNDATGKQKQFGSHTRTYARTHVRTHARANTHTRTRTERKRERQRQRDTERVTHRERHRERQRERERIVVFNCDGASTSTTSLETKDAAGEKQTENRAVGVTRMRPEMREEVPVRAT